MLLFLFACAPGKDAADGEDSPEEDSDDTAQESHLDPLTASIYAPYANCRVDGSYSYQGEVTYRFTGWRDGAGFTIAFEEDDDADGVIDSASAYTRDADELTVTLLVDEDADGDDDAFYDYTNEDHHVVRIDGDEDGDGVDDYIKTYEYDGEGYIVLVEERPGAEPGIGKDQYVYTWDRSGENPVRFGEVLHAWYEELVSTTEYTYDRYPFVGRFDYDYDADGLVDRRWDYVYDVDEHVLSGMDTHWTDGVVDGQGPITYGYDSEWRNTSIRSDFEGTLGTEVAENLYVYTCEG